MPPTVHLNGSTAIIQAIGPNEQTPWELKEPGAWCHDACDAMRGRAPNVTWNKKFHANELGRWTRTYTCEDDHGNVATAKRHFYLVSKEDPQLELRGEDPTVEEAAKGVQFLDDGATCKDQNGNDISSNVVAYGEVVNMAVPGTYMVDYKCVDSSGRAAPVLQRTVRVVDTTCPSVALVGDPIVEVEAGFPFHDQGAMAMDNIDGDISSSIRVDGDTVNTAKAYYSRGSCLEILEEAKAENRTVPSGDYYITVLLNGNNVRRVQVYCDMETDGGGYTLFPVKNGLRTSHKDNATTCRKYGLEMVVPRTADHFAAMIAKYGHDYFQIVPGIVGKKADNQDYTQFAMNSASVDEVKDGWESTAQGDWFIRDTKFDQAPKGAYTPGCWMAMTNWERGNYHFKNENDEDTSQPAGQCPFSEDTYVCSVNDKGSYGLIQAENDRDVSVYPAGAEKGKYVISYHVKDAAGNDECEAPKRTVVVKDRLKPVIDVTIGEKMVVKGVLKDHANNEIHRGQYDGQLGNDANLMAIVSAARGARAAWLSVATVLGLYAMLAVFARSRRARFAPILVEV
jgi:hypothetical protein